VRANVVDKSFRVEDFNALKKRRSVFAVDAERSSAQRENRTESETERSKIWVCVCHTFRCSNRLSTQVPFEMGLLLLYFG
jgi:hypothetical protein